MKQTSLKKWKAIYWKIAILKKFFYKKINALLFNSRPWTYYPYYEQVNLTPRQSLFFDTYIYK